METTYASLSVLLLSLRKFLIADYIIIKDFFTFFLPFCRLQRKLIEKLFQPSLLKFKASYACCSYFPKIYVFNDKKVTVSISLVLKLSKPELKLVPQRRHI